MRYIRTILIFMLLLPIHLWPLEKAFADQQDPNFCIPAQQSPSYNTAVSMSYDYGPDGLVRFYFNLDGTWGPAYAGINFYAGDCSSLGGSIYASFGLSGTRHLMAAAAPQPANPDVYYFQLEDEDTKISLGTVAPTFFATITASSIVSLGISQKTNGQIWVGSAGVRVKSVNAPKVPVLIIPGVLGTDIYKGGDLLWANPKMITGFDGFMDPMGFKPDLTPIDTSLSPGAVIKSRTILGRGLHYADGLIKNLQSQGYTEGKDLFTFPYDWRFGISEDNIKSLQGQINYILNLTRADYVYAVAHSMGGLLLKKYIFEHPGDHHVAKAIFVGTPNLGAPLALKVLVAGDNMGVPGLDPQEFKKLGQNMPAVYDLSPSANYAGKVGSFLRFINQSAAPKDRQQDLSYEGAENYLIEQNLINPRGVAENRTLHNQDFDDFDARHDGLIAYNVVGCKSATLSRFTETVKSAGPPEFNFPKLDSGDGTVPFASAQSIATDGDKTFLVPKIAHSSLLSAAGPSQQIVNILTGSNLDTGSKVLSLNQVRSDSSLCALKGHYVNIFSPVDISVTDNEGNVSEVAPDGSVDNEIPGALYQIWNGHKFVFLPDDGGQQYIITLKGMSNGTATIKDVDIENDAVVGSQAFINVPVSPQFNGRLVLSDDASGTARLEIASGPAAPFTMAPATELDAAAAADELAPAASGSLNGSLLSPGVYKSSATLSLAGDDGESGLFSLSFSLDGSPYQIYAGPVSVGAPGSHTVTFFATDRAGNSSSPQALNFAVNYKTGQNNPAGKCCGPCCPK